MKRLLPFGNLCLHNALFSSRETRDKYGVHISESSDRCHRLMKRQEEDEDKLHIPYTHVDT
jgi:hypothetical protein